MFCWMLELLWDVRRHREKILTDLLDFLSVCCRCLINLLNIVHEYRPWLRIDVLERLLRRSFLLTKQSNFFLACNDFLLQIQSFPAARKPQTAIKNEFTRYSRSFVQKFELKTPANRNKIYFKQHQTFFSWQNGAGTKRKNEKIFSHLYSNSFLKILFYTFISTLNTQIT